MNRAIEKIYQDNIASLEKELAYMKRRDSILVDAMSEVKASSEGNSTQPIVDIVADCITELTQLT